jgi:hypothetical protein
VTIGSAGFFSIPKRCGNGGEDSKRDVAGATSLENSRECEKFTEWY